MLPSAWPKGDPWRDALAPQAQPGAHAGGTQDEADRGLVGAPSKARSMRIAAWTPLPPTLLPPNDKRRNHGSTINQLIDGFVRPGGDSGQALCRHGQQELSFNLLHKGCGSRLKQQYLCIKEESWCRGRIS
jgi:hypothetical protein